MRTLFAQAVDCHNQGDMAQATLLCERVLAGTPNHAHALQLLGMVALAKKRLHDALQWLDRAVAADPRHAYIHSNRGLVLIELQRFDEALASMDTAVALDPDNAVLHSNRGLAFYGSKQRVAALACFDKALALQPASVEAWSNHGLVLKELGQTQAALQSLDQALALQPDYAKAHWNKSLVFLGNNQFAAGWALYDWGLRMPEREAFVASGAVWDGKPFDGRLFIVAEQGIGDQVLFASMLADVEALHAQITVSLTAKLIPVFKRSFPHILFVSAARPPAAEHYQRHIALGSLGRFVRAKASDFSTQPYLFADAARVAQLRSRAPWRDSRTCGISWHSSSANGHMKSIPLVLWEKLLALPQWQFINLQYGDVSQDLAALPAAVRSRVHTMEDIDCFSDIDGVAAMIAACDMVVTCSNSTAHLAGAMGKDTLLLLPGEPGDRNWYWENLQAGRSLWYPSVRMLYASSTEGWAAALAAAQALLSAGVPAPVTPANN